MREILRCVYADRNDLVDAETLVTEMSDEKLLSLDKGEDMGAAENGRVTWTGEGIAY